MGSRAGGRLGACFLSTWLVDMGRETASFLRHHGLDGDLAVSLLMCLYYLYLGAAWEFSCSFLVFCFLLASFRSLRDVPYIP